MTDYPDPFTPAERARIDADIARFNRGAAGLAQRASVAVRDGVMFVLSLPIRALRGLEIVVGWTWARALDGLDWAQESISIVRARAVVRKDAAFDDWPGPPRDDTHAGYRSEYERLAGLPHKTRDDMLLLAEMLDGLHNYGDDPLRRGQQRMAAFAPAGLVAAPVLSAIPWRLVAWGAAVVAALGLYARGEVLETQRDAARSAAAGAQAAAEGWQDRAEGAEESLAAWQDRYGADVAQAIEESRRSAVTMEERAARAARLAAREKARADQMAQARDSGSPIDFSDRLRELAEPASAAAPVPSVPPTEASGDPPG